MGYRLTQGRTRSCGCKHRALQAEASRTHGRSTTPEYRVWSGMLQRCTNPRGHGWKYYGGRGITVCERWRSFEAFLEDMGPRPGGARMTIEREDNDGPYAPWNCRWATYREQGRNRSSNVPLELFGRTMPVSAWAEELGVDARALREAAHGRGSLGWPRAIRIWVRAAAGAATDSS